MNTYSKYYNQIAPLMHEIGGELRKSYGNIDALHYKSDSAADAVTELDKKVEQFLAEKLEQQDSSIGFYGEELGGDDQSDRFWLNDPIDGTAHYIRGIPFCTTMLALIEDGEPVFSIIYDFVHDDIYWAAKGEGAQCNNSPISVSRRSLSEAYLCVEIDLEIKKNFQTWLTIKQQAIFVKTVSSGYEYVLVASGKLDGRICIKPFGKDWDYAPGALLVKEAGGVVKNIGSDGFDYKNHNFIAVNQPVYDDLLGGNYIEGLT